VSLTYALTRVRHALRKRGLRGIGILALSRLWDFIFDLRYGLDTAATVELVDLTGTIGDVAHSQPYYPTQGIALRGILRTVGGGRGRVLVDFGCGKGRVLMVASQFGFHALRGVEFSAGLCDIARRNVERFRRRSRSAADFEIIHSDAAEYVVRHDEDVFFLFNPFDQHVLGRVMHNISRSFRARPRPMLLIYRRPAHEDCITMSGFIKVGEYRIWDSDFAVFKAGPDRMGLRGEAGECNWK
jgi:SAM-dependent methyltransferase